MVYACSTRAPPAAPARARVRPARCGCGVHALVAVLPPVPTAAGWWWCASVAYYTSIRMSGKLAKHWLKAAAVINSTAAGAAADEEAEKNALRGILRGAVHGRGMAVDALNAEGVTLLMLAASKGRAHCIQVLLHEFGAGHGAVPVHVPGADDSSWTIVLRRSSVQRKRHPGRLHRCLRSVMSPSRNSSGCIVTKTP